MFVARQDDIFVCTVYIVPLNTIISRVCDVKLFVLKDFQKCFSQKFSGYLRRNRLFYSAWP